VPSRFTSLIILIAVQGSKFQVSGFILKTLNVEPVTLN